MNEQAPRRIGRYEIRREIGRGMMGVVYEAIDPLLQRPVALKTVHPVFAVTAEERASYERRFFAEARAVARLSHPGIVTIHDIGQDDGNGALFIALELLRGRTLESLAVGRATPWLESLGILSRLASALHHAHAAGVVHRDVKPENIMLLESGLPKLMDFGIARIESAQLTAAGQVFGTPRYMSPEQAHGEPVDARSDLFALGSIAYLLLTGHHAFGAPSVPRVLAQVVGEHPVPPSVRVPGIPPEVDAIVARALAKSLTARYQSALEIVEDIDDVLAHRPPRHASIVLLDAPLQTLLEVTDEVLEEVPDGSLPRPTPPVAAHREAWPALVLVVLALTLVLLFTTRSPSPASTNVATPAPVPTVSITTPPAAPAPPAEERKAATAQLALAFDHSLKKGRVRVFVGERVVLDQAFEDPADRKARRGFTRTTEVPPGAHPVRVEVTWDGSRKTAATSARFRAGSTHRLQARVGGLLKRLSLEWK